METTAWTIFFTLCGAGGLVALIVGFFVHQARKPLPPVDTGAQKKADADEKVKDQKAQEAHDQAVADAKAEGEQVNEDLVDTLKVRRDDLLKDADALNDHLKDVGKQVREP